MRWKAIFCFILADLIFAAAGYAGRRPYAQTPAPATTGGRSSIPIGVASQCVIDDAGPGNSAYGTRELYGVKITLLEVLRGNEAWARISAADASNKPPSAGFEYILARVRFEYFNTTGSTVSLPYTLRKGDFKTYSADDREYEQPAVASPVPGLMGTTFYPGASHEGWIPFLAATGDKKPLLFFFGGMWFQLY